MSLAKGEDMRILLVSSLLVAAACKAPANAAPANATTDAGSEHQPPSGASAFRPTRLEWAAVESQGVFASVLAANGRREWVFVEPQLPNTLVVHLIPIDAVVNMPNLQQEGMFLKSMWRPERDGWSPVIEVRIEPGGSTNPGARTKPR